MLASQRLFECNIDHADARRKGDVGEVSEPVDIKYAITYK
jgi:hypothetical protein